MSRLRHLCSRFGSAFGVLWQKKLTLYGRSVFARISASSFRRASGLSIAQGREPSPPAFETAIAKALPWAPAMGAWMMGIEIPKRSFKLKESFCQLMNFPTSFSLMSIRCPACGMESQDGSLTCEYCKKVFKKVKSHNEEEQSRFMKGLAV